VQVDGIITQEAIDRLKLVREIMAVQLNAVKLFWSRNPKFLDQEVKNP
jgi:hypothetical protein